MPIASNPVWPATSLAGLVALPATRTAIWSTPRPPLSYAGVDVSQAAWTYPRYRYKLSAAFLRSNLSYGEYQLLLGFFNTVHGSNDMFQYEDPNDKSTAVDNTFATGNGSRTTFQLVRTLGTFVEPVFAVNAVTSVKINGVTQPGGNYSVSNKGVITFVSPPANLSTLAWNGTFLWFCKFDSDQLDFDQITGPDSTYGSWFQAQGLSFTTQKFGS